MVKISQNKKVLNYIVEHGSIDNARAVSDLRIYRLGARIKNLRDAGYNITTVMHYDKDEYGNPTNWGEYFLDDIRGNQRVS